MTTYSLAFKLAALARLERAADVSALARELGVPRVQLYRWRWAFEAGGAAALRELACDSKRRSQCEDIPHFV